MAPLASETSESDEIARKILQDVSSLVDDNESAQNAPQTEAPASGEAATGTSTTDTAQSKPNGNGSSGAVKKPPTFVYALPGEVLKTSLNRHQRGIMDSRIYQLLTKKEIILPQVSAISAIQEKPNKTYELSKSNLNDCKSHQLKLDCFCLFISLDFGRWAIPRDPIDSSFLSTR